MYDLPYHKEPDKQIIKDFISKYPFALLTGCDPLGRPVATQVPAFLEERDGHTFVSGHIMKNTDHHKAFLENADVLMVFTGSNIYVSGSWYRNPHTPSTWNYMSVHVRGTLRFFEGPALEDVIRKTSLYFEDQDNESPTVYDNLPPQLTKRLLRMIVGFEISVSHIDAVFKLSQDRDPESYRTIIEKLQTRGEDGRTIAAEMQARFGQLFPDEF